MSQAASGAPSGRGAKGFGATDPRIPPYVEALLEPEDDVLREIRERSVKAGLPPIAVGPFDGRHLEVLARMTGARRIVEIGIDGAEIQHQLGKVFAVRSGPFGQAGSERVAEKRKRT